MSSSRICFLFLVPLITVDSSSIESAVEVELGADDAIGGGIGTEETEGETEVGGEEEAETDAETCSG